MSPDSYYFGCDLTCFSLPCSEQRKSHPSLAENVSYKGFVVRKDCTNFTLTSAAFFLVIVHLMVLVETLNWWSWALESFQCSQCSSSGMCCVLFLCWLRKLSEVFFETEREVFGGFEQISGVLGVFMVMAFLFGVFLWGL